MDIDTTLAQAVELHQTGALQQAEQLYTAILAREPEHADALHLLGLINFANDEYAGAAELIQRAIEYAPNAVYYFNLGNVYRAQDALEAAADAYREALARQADEADYHNNLGEVLAAQGHWEQARDCYARAVALQPGDAVLQLNLAQAQRVLGQPEAAISNYQRAAELDPDNPWIALDLGTCLQQMGQLDAAATHYRQALALEPDMTQAHNNLGGIHHARGELAEAVACYTAALTADPQLAEAHRNLAGVLEVTGERKRAIHHYREALRIKPDYAEAAYKLAALRGEAAPASAPPEYVASLFDQYADDFDAHLTGALGYRTPQQLRELFTVSVPDATGLQVLDLGCGTGLSGAVFRDCAAWLCGVDLSPRMIAKAEQRGIYDALHVGEVLARLQADTARWDLVLAADVFVYLGELDAIMRAAAAALRPGGWLVFSVEQADASSARFTLHEAGRYAHHPQYLRELAGHAGFRLLAEEQAILRQNLGRDVSGLLYVMQAPRPAA